MDLVSELTHLGGVATRRKLVQCRGRREIDQAIREQQIVPVGRGRWALPDAGEANLLAADLGAVLSHRSAATWLGWEQKVTDHLPDITLPRNRSVPEEFKDKVNPHWADLSDDDRDSGRTSKIRTICDCMRALPFDEAMPITDSAIRADDFSQPELVILAGRLRGKGARQARRVAALATSKAANQFESTLRAIAVDVPGLDVEAQCPVTLRNGKTIHPDLGDAARRIAIEAESFAYHGDLKALRRDCQRYNALAQVGWVVVRFTWDEVMFKQDEVRAVLVDVVAQRPVVRQEAQAPSGLGRPA